MTTEPAYPEGGVKIAPGVRLEPPTRPHPGSWQKEVSVAPPTPIPDWLRRSLSFSWHLLLVMACLCGCVGLLGVMLRIFSWALGF